MKVCHLLIGAGFMLLAQSCTNSASTEVTETKPSPEIAGEKIRGVDITTKANDRYLFEYDNIALEVDALDGARISSLKLGSNEFLSLEDVNDKNWGSTFWSSPQSEWGWPPPKSFDQTPYNVVLHDDHIIATSSVDSLTHYSFTKEIYLDTKDTSVAINYQITNNSDTIKQVAPWEITRVPPNGLTVYAAKPGSYTSPFTVIDSLGFVWFDFKSSVIPDTYSGKLIGGANEGWIAHVDKGHILIKHFEHKEEFKYAPGEGEIEIYADYEKKYVEIEPQGPYVPLNPGEHLSWKLKWIVKKLPEDVEASVGSQSLIDYIHSIVSTHDI